jgi:hypothetical protein
MDIEVWLRSLGLGKYEAPFRENEIGETVLPNRGPMPAFASKAATGRSPVAEQSGLVWSDRRRWR